MKIFVPDYYRSFACLMGDCMHSCCVGWEIDIDAETRAAYRTVPGPMGKRLRDNIADGDEASFFRLTEDERCPFLNREGLCELILNLGEDSLCQICADHPRFRSFFSNRTEIGLGLCCEAAGKLILSQTTPVHLEIIDDDGIDPQPDDFGEDLLALRSELISIAQDRSLSIDDRAKRILSRSGLKLPLPDPAFFLSLERLDEAWADCLNMLHQFSGETPFPEGFAIPFEQLLVYLLYRHLPLALDDGDVAGHIAYSVWMWLLVRLLCASHADIHGQLTLDDMVEICRLYSSEIEYSDENIAAVIDYILA